jgi:hypothetical protein
LQWRLIGNGQGIQLETLDQGRARLRIAHGCAWRTVRVGVRHEGDPEDECIATLDILPRDPFALVALTLGKTWMEEAGCSWSCLQPTLTAPDSLDSSRFQGSRWHVNSVGYRKAPYLVTGYGLPLRVPMPFEGKAAVSLLSMREVPTGEGKAWFRQDATGMPYLDHAFKECPPSYHIETLRPRSDGYRSTMHFGTLQHRGCYPMAGDPWGEPAHADGRGLAARFQDPCGIAEVSLDPGDALGMKGASAKVVVADGGGHTLRRVDDNRVVTEAGVAGDPGYRDGKGAEARFHGPTFVAAIAPEELPLSMGDFKGGEGRILLNPSRTEYLVADSGNHVIRHVDSGGNVTTLAGGPNDAGYQDAADPAKARFSNPQGVAVSSGGTIFVADRGNHVIRKIAGNGAVTTLAGHPGAPGIQDGTGPEARFHDLRGLTADADRNLYVVDGHAVRRIDAISGEVATLIGQAGVAGFQDFPPGPLAQDAKNEPLHARPCLNAPWSLQVFRDTLFIADRGNHALRAHVLGTRSLTTVAGNPGEGAVRWGLLRNGIAHPDERHAALKAPKGIAVGYGGVVVAMGPCLGHLRFGSANPATRYDPVLKVTHTPPQDGKGRHQVAVDARRVWEPGQAVYLDVQCLSADGPSYRRKAVWRDAEPFVVEGDFSKGSTLRVTCVTQSGLSFQEERRIE